MSRTLRRERALDHLGHLLGGSAGGAALRRHSSERRDPVAVELSRAAVGRLSSSSALLGPRVQIGVRIEPGSTIVTWIRPRPQLDPQRVGDRLERVLRRCVRPEERERAPAGDRADEDDPAASAAECGHEGLRHGDLPDDVDLELMAQLVERHELERHRDRDARVVDERVELLDTLGRPPAIWPASVTSSCTSSVPVGRLARPANARQHAPPRAREPGRAGGADARRTRP